jgi:hypothetical protein
VDDVIRYPFTFGKYYSRLFRRDRYFGRIQRRFEKSPERRLWRWR